jgi:hypothetical protein
MRAGALQGFGHALGAGRLLRVPACLRLLGQSALVRGPLAFFAHDAGALLWRVRAVAVTPALDQLSRADVDDGRAAGVSVAGQRERDGDGDQDAYVRTSM